MYIRKGYPLAAVGPYIVINPHVECMVVHLEKMLVVVIYRHPFGKSSHFWGFFGKLLCFLRPTSLPFVVEGDINIITPSNEARSHDFHDIITSYGSRNTIALAARVTPKTATSKC